MQTSIIAQDNAIDICNKALQNPTHLFIYGFNGLGKTTLAFNFLDSYAKHNGLEARDPDFFLCLTADKDRGIHTIRQRLSDFTRGAPKKPGIIRWVLIDDADTLPEVSQQALRRPMEQYVHLTCFIFIANSSDCLIHALQSRCQPIQLEPVPIMLHIDTILEEMKYKIKDDGVKSWLASASLSSIAEFKRMAETLQWIAPESPTIADAKDICSTYDYDKIIPLVKAIANHNSDEIYKNIGLLWQNGMSFEDILHTIQHTADLYFILPSKSQELLYTFLVTGWSYHAQSRCSFLDILGCAMDVGLLDKKV